MYSGCVQCTRSVNEPVRVLRVCLLLSRLSEGRHDQANALSRARLSGARSEGPADSPATAHGNDRIRRVKVKFKSPSGERTIVGIIASPVAAASAAASDDVVMEARE